MAVYKIFPTKDTTLYNQYPARNTGLDQILEASSYDYKGTRFKSRYLIQFSTTEIQNVIDSKTSGSWVSYLKAYNAATSGLSIDTNLYFYKVSGSWEMGTGILNSNPEVSNGASWDFRDVSGSIRWGSAGGDYDLTPVYSQSFSYSSPLDLNVNVSDTIESWYSESSDNNGFIVKLSDSIEDSTNINIQPIFKYFSIDTSTIYPPYLEFKWSDYTFNTGSSTNTILTTPEAFISIYNNV